MGGHGSHDIKAQVRVYFVIFMTLMFLTVVTVAVSYLHLTVPQAVALALAIAFIKASLVACHFMHLLSERVAIYLSLAITVFFFFVLLLIPTLYFWNAPGAH